ARQGRRRSCTGRGHSGRNSCPQEEGQEEAFQEAGQESGLTPERIQDAAVNAGLPWRSRRSLHLGAGWWPGSWRRGGVRAGGAAQRARGVSYAAGLNFQVVLAAGAGCILSLVG